MENLYLFLTVNRLKENKIREQLIENSQGFTDVKVYVFNTMGHEFDPSITERAMREQLRLPIKVYEVTKVFDPPKISDGDVIINCIEQDEELQPLTGGYITLNRWINKQSVPIILL